MTSQSRRLRILAVLVAFVVLAVASPALAVDLAVKKACISMPDGTVTDINAPAATCPSGTIQIWRFKRTDIAETSPVAPGALVINATEGDNLTINVSNELGIPVSLFINGQAMSNNTGPVWLTDISNPYGPSITGSRPAGDVTSRVRSFAHEAPAGVPGTPGASTPYTWNGLETGTYIITSGTHPSLQVQMGLYAALVVKTAGGAPYAGEPVPDNDQVLFFSEIDPAIHNAANDVTKSFPSTNTYFPKYFLINGKPFPGNNPIPLPNPGTTLLRFANAGLDTYIPLLQGQSMQVIAEDGNLKAANLQFTRHSVDLHAGKTFDAVMTNPVAAGYIPVYDRRLYMSNAAQAPGGMLAYLEIPDGAQNMLTVTTTGGTGKGRVVAESMPGGINCDSSIVPPAPGATDCTQLYNAGTELKLVGYPNPGSILNTWTGCITVTAANECLVTMDAVKTVAASFAAVTAVQLITPANNEQIPQGARISLGGPRLRKQTTFTLRYSLDGGVTWVLIGKNLTGNSPLDRSDSEEEQAGSSSD
jgi:FtsP/CotA-like multicopper oxidase with cupredoxin domain